MEIKTYLTFIAGGMVYSFMNPLLDMAFNKFEERNLDSKTYVVPSEMKVKYVDLNLDGKNEATCIEYAEQKYLFQIKQNVPTLKPIKGLEAEVEK